MLAAARNITQAYLNGFFLILRICTLRKNTLNLEVTRLQSFIDRNKFINFDLQLTYKYVSELKRSIKYAF